MSIKFFRHTGNQRPAELSHEDSVTAYLADGRFWRTHAGHIDWTSGDPSSPLCWAHGIQYPAPQLLAGLVADALVALTNATEPVPAEIELDELLMMPRVAGAPEVVEIKFPIEKATSPDKALFFATETVYGTAPSGSKVTLAAVEETFGMPNAGDAPAVVATPEVPAQPDADGWISWNGGDKPPLPGDHLVDVRNKSGMELEHREVADIAWVAVSAYRPLNAKVVVHRPAYDPDNVAFKREPEKIVSESIAAVAEETVIAPKLVVTKAEGQLSALANAAETQWYLSGPMSGLPENNFPAFTRAAELLRGMGLQIVNPAEQTAVPDGSAWADYMRHDIKLLMDCKGVICLPGWRDSGGARLEVRIAEALGMPVLAFEHLPKL